MLKIASIHIVFPENRSSENGEDSLKFAMGETPPPPLGVNCSHHTLSHIQSMNLLRNYRPFQVLQVKISASLKKSAFNFNNAKV